MTDRVAAAVVGIAAMTGMAQAQNAPTSQETVNRAAHVCVACHGDGGRSETASIPSLAGQTRGYMVAQLRDFRAQVRAEPGARGYMWGISALLDDATIDGLADHFAAQTPAPGKPGKAALVQAGREIFVNGIPALGVIACATCHGEGARGAAGFPRLAGQHADYVYAQLKVFGTALRPHGQVMRAEVKPLSPDDMRAVAEYVQSL
jgi:cytochrome c553